MSLYAIGDLHLAQDPALDKSMDVFGPAWKDHTERICEDWRARVSPEDTVILAGDISWGLRLDEAMADLELIHSLPGRKVLVRGNHDLWWQGITKLNNLFSDMIFLQNTCVEAEGVSLCGSRGWICPESDEFTQEDERIYRRELIRMEMSLEAARKKEAGEIIAVIHHPPAADPEGRSGFTDLFEEYRVRRVLYGHLHGKEAFAKGIKGLHRGVEYQLISLDYLHGKLAKII